MTCHFEEEEDGEEAASPDVGRAVAVARPLLQQYQVQYAELRRCLWRAQSAAVTATQDGRERSQLQLKTFANIEVGCAELERDLSGESASQQFSNFCYRFSFLFSSECACPYALDSPCCLRGRASGRMHMDHMLESEYRRLFLHRPHDPASDE